MKLFYEYGTQRIEFTVVFRNRKTMLIEVEAPKTITVTVPVGTAENKILEMVKTKSKWIVKKLFDIKDMEYRKRTRQYVNGESFIYMGRNYSLQIILDYKAIPPEAKLIRGKICVYTCLKDDRLVRLALENWYKDKAREKIQERINYYQPYFDVKPAKITVKDQKKRWGSCSSRKSLLFNWKCIMAPSPVLDYIVVHEMCHLVHMNHSKEFWQLLKRVLPDYENRKAWLKNNGVKCDL
ncbi:MAG: M48 family metallopeptidase [Ruminiclostridium sp.]|nr:M48 family metallopeptidase [Ruminiclostridium sp.]